MFSLSQRFLFLLSLTVSFLLAEASSSIEAVGVEWEGYFRTRTNFDINLDMDRGSRPQTQAYTDFRFRLDPSFHITDRIRIRSSLNFIDGVFGDTPFRGMAYSNPARANHPLFDDNAGSQVGKSIPPSEMSSWVYGGAYAPDGAVQTTDLRPLQVRRAWAEVDFDLGSFRAGRMPYHFGLGILGNAGDDPNQEIGSTRDRILFETGIGSYYLAPGVGWFLEGDLGTPDDDSYEYFFVIGRKVENQHLALYLSYLAQDSALLQDQSSRLAGEKTKYWVVNFYAQNQFGPANFEAEIAFFAGKFLGFDLLALNAAGRGTWDFGKFGLLHEVGYSSGTSDSDIDKGDMRSFAFNRDYNIAYILFNEPLPTSRSLEDSGQATAPRSGAISNTVYGRVQLGYEVARFFEPHLNVVFPYAISKSGGATGHFYGIEYNLITRWPINEYVSGEATFAHFIPGSFYDGVSKTHSALMLRGGMFVRF